MGIGSAPSCPLCVKMQSYAVAAVCKIPTTSQRAVRDEETKTASVLERQILAVELGVARLWTFVNSQSQEGHGRTRTIIDILYRFMELYGSVELAVVASLVG